MVDSNQQLILDADAISRSVSRISYEILEKNHDVSKLAIVGIRTAGEFLAKRIQERIKSIEGKEPAFGYVDITLYRDDIAFTESQPVLKGTQLDFEVSNKHIILVDDVLYTGRTVRAALDAIIDYGRPKCVELAVLIDRGHRELPIRADYVGKNIPTALNQKVKVTLVENGNMDAVYLVGSKS